MKKFILTLILFPIVIFSQELDAKVVINFEQLDTSSKERLANFKSELENYLNSARYTDDAWEGPKIPCQFNIFFSGSFDEVNYRAQVVVTSQRPIYKSQSNSLMLKVQDKNWAFMYERNQSMYFNPSTFDPLTSFFDFYAYLILGFDADSFNELGGSDYFTKANNLAILGSTGQYSDGWESNSSTYSRRGIVDDLANAKFQSFRKNYYNYHYNGLDLLRQDKNTAYKSLELLVNDLYKNVDKMTRSVLIRVFFGAKAGEIVEYFKDYPKDEIFSKLKKVDPSHISKYNELLDSRK